MADSTTKSLQRLNSSAPGPLAKRARRARLVGERKPVTAVFADIVGSTSLAESIDPEDWTLIINAAFDEMSRCIFDYEGTIAQLQGDAIISFFGAPVAHEDDPERAVRAALAMIAAMADYGAELERTEGIDFRIRIGISTGLVLVGNVGSDLRYDYTAIGDTMNLAARLESAAPPGAILISEKTWRFVHPFFELEDIGALELKGKSDAIQSYRVVGPSSDPGSSRGLPGLESPMVGRTRELETLLELTATARAGRGRIAVIVAEPGMGKTRLLAELHSEIDERESTSVDGGAEQETAWVVGQSVSYGQQMPFHVITDLLLNVLGMKQSSPVEEIEAALRGLLDELLPGDAEALDYLAYLMGLDVAGQQGDEATLPSGEFLAERLAGAVLRLLKQVAHRGPLMIVLEDLHWSDAASADLLQALLTLPDHAAVLIVATTREERSSAGWAVVDTARDHLGQALAELHLEPLDRLGSQLLVANLLEIDSLPIATRDLILEKAEGNPLFVEEVIRMLVERGALERIEGHWRATGDIEDVAIPDTIHGLVLARIDRLPDEARRVLRLASCIDRQFSWPLLEDVARAGGLETTVGPALSRLEAANLLVLAATSPELEYRFSHALIRDAAYESLLRQERRQWHGLVAQALLARYPDRETELADRLAHHFELSGDRPRAIHYLVIAADRAASRNAMIDASALYQRAADLLNEDDGATSLDQERVGVALGLIASRVEMLATDEVWAILLGGRAAAERAGDDVGLTDLLFWEIALREWSGEESKDSPALQASIDRLGELGDIAGDSLQRSQALARSGLFRWWNGDFHGSLDVLQRASTLFEERGDRIGAAMAESYTAADHASLGSFDEADRHMAEAHRLSEGADRLAQLDYHLAEAALASVRGDYGKSIRFASDCLAGSSEIGALGCATVSGIVLGASQMASGAIEDARVSLERSIELATQGSLAPQRLQGDMLLATVHGLAGDLAKAESGFHAAISALATVKSPYNEAEARMARGLVLATHPAGDAASGLEDLDAAAATFESLGARPSQARTMRARGIALARLGRADDADASLARAASMASEMGLLDAPWPESGAELQALGATEPPILPLD